MGGSSTTQHLSAKSNPLGKTSPSQNPIPAQRPPGASEQLRRGFGSAATALQCPNVEDNPSGALSAPPSPVPSPAVVWLAVEGWTAYPARLHLRIHGEQGRPQRGTREDDAPHPRGVPGGREHGRHGHPQREGEPRAAGDRTLHQAWSNTSHEDENVTCGPWPWTNGVGLQACPYSGYSDSCVVTLQPS